MFKIQALAEHLQALGVERTLAGRVANLARYHDVETFLTYTQPSEILSSAFLWSDTEEGHAFWHGVWVKTFNLEGGVV